MLDSFIGFLVICVMNFESFDIAIVFVLRKREGGLWFRRIWTYNKDFVAKEAKESKERGNQRCQRALERRWCGTGGSAGVAVQYCWFL